MKHEKNHKEMESNHKGSKEMIKKMQPASEADMKVMMKKMECNMDMGRHK